MASAVVGAGSSSSFSSRRRYDVFLSFRGEDTRNNFTAHLYQALRQKGIDTFIDYDRLERGQVISPAIAAAIENSMFSIVVLSQNYACSRWCLEELVKIVECMKSSGHSVLPIFYNVDPSDVKKQMGVFGEALAKHEESSENMERVQRWKDALTQVANLSGWDSRNKNEAVLIREIVTSILNKLLSTSVSDMENLVGIDVRIQEIEMILCLESKAPMMVGIWGMGGIGKTTLATAVYNKIRTKFEACSFLENVGEGFAKEGSIRLQQKLLSQLLEEENVYMKAPASIKQRLQSKKVLIVLDNVNDKSLFKDLAGNSDWFGRGSRIIITTRDKNLLVLHGVDNYYEARGFTYDEALKFLLYYSSKHELPQNDHFIELCNEVISYAQGLPLALEVLSSFIFIKKKEEWKDRLAKLKNTPNKKIQEVLKVSCDGLDDKEMNIFLDIACFFKGENRDYVTDILDGCGFHPISGIQSLIDKSLITTSENRLMMHELIQEMGREIACQQSLEKPWKRSRLWFHKDIYNVLTKDMANEKVEGIFLNLSDLKKTVIFPTQAFLRMNRLRLLKVYESKNISRNFTDTSYKENCMVKYSRDFKFCYEDLSCLYLYGYSFRSLPDEFNPRNLVELSMPYSHIKQLWTGIKVLEKLKYMDLRHSKNLIKTPDFSGVTNLRRLVLKGCVSLREVHSSVGELKNLNLLNLKNCKMLKSLPSSTCDLRSLETLILSGCSKMEEFPENLGRLQMLKELCGGEIAVRELPPSFCLLRNLEVLSFRGYKGPTPTFWGLLRRSSHSIVSILQPLSSLSSLVELNLSYCNLSDETDLSCLGLLSSLRKLTLGGNNFITLPLPFDALKNLSLLNLENCIMLKSLPSSTCDLKSLETLVLSGCLKIEAFPENIGRLEMLKELYAEEIILREFPPSFRHLSNLKVLALRGIKALQAPPEPPSLKRTFQLPTNKFKEPLLESDHLDVKLGKLFATLDAFSPRNMMEDWIKYQSSCSEEEKGKILVILCALTLGNRKPELIAYQGSGSEVQAELLPNWFSSNFWCFSLSLVSCCMFFGEGLYEADISFDRLSNDDPSSVDITTGERIFISDWLDHLFLFDVLLPKFSNCSQVTRIKVSHGLYSKVDLIRKEIKRRGMGLVYFDEDGNHSNPPMIQFNYIPSPHPPPLPPNNSTVIHEEIHEGEPSEKGGSINVNDGLEETDSEYYSAAEEEVQSSAIACSEVHSESEKCRH